MRTSSNPVFRNLPQGQGGYASFGGAAAGAAQAGQSGYGQQAGQFGAPSPYQTGPVQRSMTIDDVVTKTGITLGVLVVGAIINYLISDTNPDLGMVLTFGGAIVGLGLVLVATFGRKQDSKAIVLAYAVAEGLFVGGISNLFADAFGGGLITNAVIGTIGVFAGMLVVYKTGAIRVTPKFTRMIVGGIIGVAVLMVANMVASIFTDGGFGLRDGGPLAIGFSLLCIGLAAFSFLLDFDQADQMIRVGAPEKAAWGVALGLTVTLVWLYVEILQLLSYFSSD